MGVKYIDFDEQQFLFGTTTLKAQNEMLKFVRNLGAMTPLASLTTSMPAGGLLDICGRPGARGHHIGDPDP